MLSLEFYRGPFLCYCLGRATPASTSSLPKGHTSPCPIVTKFDMSFRGSSYISIANSHRISKTALVLEPEGPSLTLREFITCLALDQSHPLCLSSLLGCTNCLITQGLVWKYLTNHSLSINISPWDPQGVPQVTASLSHPSSVG